MLSMPRRGAFRSRTHRHNRNYNTHTTTSTKKQRPKKDKKFNMPNSSGALKSGFSLPWLIGAYLLGSVGMKKDTTVVHRDREQYQQGGYIEEQVKEVPQLPETDPCFNQYRSMMDCLEANGSETSECAKFHSLEV